MIVSAGTNAEGWDGARLQTRTLLQWYQRELTGSLSAEGCKLRYGWSLMGRSSSLRSDGGA